MLIIDKYFKKFRFDGFEIFEGLKIKFNIYKFLIFENCEIIVK